MEKEKLKILVRSSFVFFTSGLCDVVLCAVAELEYARGKLAFYEAKLAKRPDHKSYKAKVMKWTKAVADLEAEEDGVSSDDDLSDDEPPVEKMRARSGRPRSVASSNGSLVSVSEANLIKMCRGRDPFCSYKTASGAKHHRWYCSYAMRPNVVSVSSPANCSYCQSERPPEAVIQEMRDTATLLAEIAMARGDKAEAKALRDDLSKFGLWDDDVVAK
jgi:hypothetical protein